MMALSILKNSSFQRIHIYFKLLNIKLNGADNYSFKLQIKVGKR